ncbi:MAG: AAA family ATPase [Candidatus Peribacteria bacterium]|jgi:AAA+ ATPase superfamily predicted ATPase|nr:AAA family ATPase [Candidatus Peribacteria bacterium]
MFFDRENFIDIYQQKLEFFTSKKWQNTYHLAFLGLRRTGKTTLIQQLFEYYSKGQLTFYFDFSALATTPLNFSRELIFALFSKIDGNMYIDLDELRINQTQPELLEAVKNYQKVITTGNEYKIIDVTFSMITLLSKYHNMIIAFDEFQELLNFRNFRDLKQIDALFRSHLLNQTKVFYLISGSYPEIIKDLILNPHNMLYSHFEIYEIGNFDQKTSRAYTKYLSPHLDNKTIRTIYTATN